MKISVIVCTYNRSYAIGACLDSIADSLAAAAPVEGEIIVVDNASTDDTAAVIKKWAATCAFPVQALYEPRKGVSAARNRGIRAAKGELLTFTDDDCRLSKNFVVDALRHDAADTQLVLRGGRVELGDQADLPLTTLTAPALMQWHRPANAGKFVRLRGGSILGCNMTMRRALVDRIGFFDERLGPGTSLHAAEDTDYVFRVYLADLMVEYVPDMIVFHFHGRKTEDEGKKLIKNYVIGTGALYAKYMFRHPNLAGKMPWNAKKQQAFTGGKAEAPSCVDIPYKAKLFYAALGALKYRLLP